MKDLNGLVDFTLLKANVTASGFVDFIEKAKQYKPYSVCVNPVNVKRASELLKDTGIKICAVIGFPLGQNTTYIKDFETEKALLDGADEIDMVANLSYIASGNYEEVVHEINSIKGVINNYNISLPAVDKRILKVILETGLIDELEILTELCDFIDEHSILEETDYLKTSTGFARDVDGYVCGADIRDIKVMKECTKFKVKASGGIRDCETAQRMIAAGADRIGASKALSLIQSKEVQLINYFIKEVIMIPGDRVRVKAKEELLKTEDKGHGIVSEMLLFCGQSGIITEVQKDGCGDYYIIDIDDEGWYWDEWMITKIKGE